MPWRASSGRDRGRRRGGVTQPRRGAAGGAFVGAMPLRRLQVLLAAVLPLAGAATLTVVVP